MPMTHSNFAAPALLWMIEAECPPGWEDDVARMDGGFFHTSGGLAAAAVRGEPFFARLRQPDVLVGLTAGIRTPCRLTGESRHIYLPTIPAVPHREIRHAALHALVGALERDKAASVSMDSYDGRWQVTNPGTRPAELTIHR